MTAGHAGVDPNYGAGQGGSGFGGFGGFDFDLGDIFSSFFGEIRHGSRGVQTPTLLRGVRIFTTLTISFEEAAKGCKKTVNVDRIEVCDTCSGSRLLRHSFSDML